MGIDFSPDMIAAAVKRVRHLYRVANDASPRLAFDLCVLRRTPLRWYLLSSVCTGKRLPLVLSLQSPLFPPRSGERACVVVCT